MEPSLSEIEAVYRRRGADFFRLALARTGDPDEAREAVQEGFAHAIRARESYRGAGLLEAWVARCVINAAFDAHRADARAPELVGDLEERAESLGDDLAASSLSLDPDGALVREAVRRLPQRQRDALFLRFYLGFDYAAIAEALGIEVGTVSAMLHTARASLARDLQEVSR